MSKKQAVLIIVVSVFFAEVLNIFFGPLLSAKISTWPILNRLHILSPQAPIVITNRQTVRVDNSGDIIASLAQIKSEISTIVLVSGGSENVTGSSLNLTTDGDFVTASQSFNQTNGNYFVVLNDGRTAKITSRIPDPATSLTFFKASLGSVPVVNFASSKTANAGDQLIFISNSLQNFIDRAILANVSFPQNDIQGQIFSSDYPRRGFGFAPNLSLINGQALINTGAGILGIWNGTSLISSDVLTQAVNLYLANNQKISRPSFGFTYETITENESALDGNPQGALVKTVLNNSPAHQSGLLAGDIVTSFGGNQINENSSLEEVLQNYKPNDKVALTIQRKSQILNLNLVVGELH